MMKKTTLLLMSGWLFATSSLVYASPSKQVTVGADDTVYRIAYDNGITTHALIAANNLTPPYVLAPGQVLIVPSPHEHIVGRGETLRDVADTHGVNVDALAQENNISSPDAVRPGKTLVLPARDTVPHAEILTPQSAEIATSSLAPLPLVKVAPPSKGRKEGLVQKKGLSQELAAELAQERETVDSAQTTEPQTPAKKKQVFVKDEPRPKKKDEKDTTEKKKKKEEEKKEQPVTEKEEPKKDTLFIWPAEGPVISEFGANGKSDGINIELPVGSEVKASAAGEVMYAGGDLKDLGQLLLIKHQDKWVTAYAHLSELKVGKGDKVKKGQVIALSGKTGNAKQPQLHFEIRKGKKPIDPLGKLGQ